MQLKIFVIPTKNPCEFEAEMNRFLRGHRVLTVRKEFVVAAEDSFWTFCVEYLDVAVAVSGIGESKGPKVDYKNVLKPEEFDVFLRLREWRKRVAEKEGVPVYVVFSNEQLAAMVRGRMTTKAALKGVEGVGDARVEKYGDAVLELLVFNPVPA